MSRRRQSRALENTQAVEESEQWAEVATSRVPADWRTEWAPITLDVVHRVWSKQGAKIYFQPRDRWLRDDLRGWLTIEAARIATTFQPSETHEAPERQWGAYLWKTLNGRAIYHFGNVVGARGTPTGQAARDAHIRGIDSTDRLDAWEAETGFHTERYALHSQDLFTRDPEIVYIAMENLEAHIREVENWKAVTDSNGGAYRVRSTECEMTGCHNVPVNNVQRLCQRHYYQERTLWKVPSEVACNIPDCDRPRTAVGLCNTHQASFYKGRLAPDLLQYVVKPQPKEPQVCSVEGCHKVLGSHDAWGMCGLHGQRKRKADSVGATEEQADEYILTGDNSVLPRRACSLEGCEAPVRGRGLCLAHWRAELRAERGQ